MLKACTVCGTPSDQARCPAHRYTRQRGTKARAQRMRVIERDGFRCQRCSKPLSGGRDTHVDHRISLAERAARGLPTTGLADSEFATLCEPCNLSKGAR